MTTVDRIEFGVNKEIAIRFQKLVFSEDHSNPLSHANKFDLVDMGPFRKINPKFNISQSLDKATHSYKKNDAQNYTRVEMYFKELEKILKEHKHLFPDIRTCAKNHAWDNVYK